MNTFEFHIWLRRFQVHVPLPTAFRAFLQGMGGGDEDDGAGDVEEVSSDEIGDFIGV